MKHWHVVSIIVAIACLDSLFGPARADGSIKTAHVEVELVSEYSSARPGDSISAGIRLKMDVGWHIYWLNWGEAGLPTSVQWELPVGWTPIPIGWPFPHRFEQFGVVAFGYEGEMLLPVQITPGDVKADHVTLAAHVKWLACEALCIPGEATVQLNLPIDPDTPSPDPRWQTLFASAKQDLPRQPAPGQVQAARSDDLLLLLRIKGFEVDPLPKITFFPFERNVIDYAAEQTVQRQDSDLTVSVALSNNIQDPFDQLSGVLVVEAADGTKALAIDMPIGEAAAPPLPQAEDEPGLSLILAMLYALIGGLILNLMPCVFPVLSIKVLGFVQHAGDQRASIRLHGCVFAFGVVLSFWVLIAILLALRAGGDQLGWGFQLQTPQFVAVMALLMFAVGLNLAGVYELGIGAMNLAGRSASRIDAGSYAGSLFSGVLATAIATPCTAPFMGPAIGFALTLSPFQTFAVFTALGVGMALPYVVLSFFPGWIRWLPKPGPWMVAFKQVMAFPMFASAIWLVWVFGHQVGGANGILFLLLGMLVLSLGAWIFGQWGTPDRSVAARRFAWGLGGVLVCASVAVPLWATPRLTGEVLYEWEDYSDERVDELRAEGRVVFVDFTADWCLSCQFNERTVLGQDEVRQTFSEHDVAVLRADWTLRDEHIGQALARFERNSVPLYVVYSPDQSRAPIVLPTLITARIIQNAVSEAASKAQAFRVETGKD